MVKCKYALDIGDEVYFINEKRGELFNVQIFKGIIRSFFPSGSYYVEMYNGIIQLHYDDLFKTKKDVINFANELIEKNKNYGTKQIK